MERKNKIKPVIISPEAQNDIKKIADYLFSSWGIKILNKFLQKLAGFYEVVAAHPHLFPFYNKSKNIRKFVITKQSVIFYRSKRKTIEIIAVYDTSQRPATIKKDVSRRRKS